MIPPPIEALRDLEREVVHALESGNESGLSVLGYGEISTVVALELEDRRYACKRMPPFSSQTALDGYRSIFTEYVERLAMGKTTVVDTELMSLPSSDGVVAYFVQPMLAREQLLPNVLARASQAEADDLFERLVERIVETVTPEVGLDAQLSNWAEVDGGLRYFDVTTPLLRASDGAERLDLDVHLASLPWLLRGVVRRFMARDILDTYFEPRTAIVDLAGNLHKERLPQLIPRLLACANAALAEPISTKEVERYYENDSLLWEALLRLRRADRAWQRRVRGRTYPFLLPGDVER